VRLKSPTSNQETVIQGDVRELSEERVRVFVVSRGVDISDRELEV